MLLTDSEATSPGIDLPFCSRSSAVSNPRALTPKLRALPRTVARILVVTAALIAGSVAFAGADPLLAAAKLRTYCKACHAVGKLKFILSDDDRVLWNSLFVNTTPVSGRTWAQGIVDVLSWPSDNAPPFDRIMDPPGNRDWMPRGAKRLDIAADSENGVSVRRLIIRALNEHLTGDDF